MNRVCPYGLIIFLIFNIAQNGYGEIILEGQSKSLVPVNNGNNIEINIDQNYGTVKGNNLLHQFSKFDILENEHVIFNGGDFIENVIARVKGSSKSTINGAISCSIQNANLFLINPKGIIFGREVKIDVNGLFCVTTSNDIVISSIEVKEQQLLDSKLLTIDSNVIEFLDISGPINMESSTINTSGSIAFIGEEIYLYDSYLKGDITIDGLNITLKETEFESDKFALKGEEIYLYDSYLLSKGDINIDGMNLTINETTGIISELRDNTKRSIHINIKENLSLLDGSFIHLFKYVPSFDSGTINIYASNIKIGNKSKIRSKIELKSDKVGYSGNISIKASEDIEFLSESSVNTVSYENNDAGNITISGRNIFFKGASDLASQTYGKGKGGDIVIEARETLSLGGASNNNDNSCSITSYSYDAGDAGNITVNAKKLDLYDGGKIVAGSRSSGQGGNIIINIDDSMSIQGKNLKESIPDLGFSSGISSYAKQNGNAGKISINVGNDINIKNGGEITTSSFAKGNAGNIHIKSSQLILENQASITSESKAKEEGGMAGNIDIDCNKNIQLLGNSQLTNEAKNSRKSLNEQGTGRIDLYSKETIYLNQSTINTSVRGGSSDAGNINTYSDQMILNHSKITANAYEGTGGSIYIVAGQFVKSSDSIIQADSELGMNGNIYIHSPDTNVEKDIIEPSKMYIDASDLLATACDRRSGDSISRLIWEGKSGISFTPEDWIPGNFHFSNLVKKMGIVEIEKGESALRNASYEQSIKHLRNALLFLKDNNMDASSKNHIYVETKIGIATSYMRLGFYKKADRILSDLYPRIEKYRTAYLESIYFTTLCDLSLSMGNTHFNDYFTKHLKKINPEKQYIIDYSKAKYLIGQAIKTQNDYINAMVLNQMGIFLAVKKDYDKALSLYSKSITIIDNTKMSKAMAQLSIKVQMNRLKTLMMNKDVNKDEMNIYIENCLQDVELLINEVDPLDLISLSLQLWKLNQQFKIKKQNINYHRYLSLAKNKALSLKNHFIASQVLGMIGHFHEDEKKYQQALKATRKAIVYADLVNADEILVLFYQQMGRLYTKMGKTNHSLESYQRAINLITPLVQSCYFCKNDETSPPGIMHYCFSGYRNAPHQYFDIMIKPIFKEYLELLSLQTSNNNAPNDQKVLKEMRNVIEIWISTDIQNYFKDECLISYKKGMETIDNGLPETAIIHPIILNNELNILVTLPDQIVRISKPFKNINFVSLINQFRNSLEIDTMLLNNNKLPPYNTNIAKQLYDLIISPCLEYFDNYNIKTLVFVPTDELRNIPFSALYDGHHFLIEKFSIVNVPALLITDMKKQELIPEDIFLGGITDLPMIKSELHAIRDIMGGGKIMLDENFCKNTIINEFKHNSYSIIILSTHAQFDDLLKNTFIQTFDDKLYMNDLEKMIRFGMFRKNRTELLILDACQTSKGNDQSSLGFSGIAIKSGAKSVIGSLWSVLDEFSYLFMVDFFKGIKNKYENKMLTKAQIFQDIQKQYIYDSRFNHPAYWSAFILLGNWL